jgi:hypothetical protein
MKILIHLLFLSFAVLISCDDKNQITEPIILDLSECNDSSTHSYVPHGTTSVAIKIRECNNSSIAIHIPSSVQKIDLHFREINNSGIILYLKHNPHIMRSLQEFNRSTIQEMHPLRQYDYYVIGTAAAIYASYCYLKKIA